MTANQRAAKIELRPDKLRPVPLEFESVRTELAELLPFADEVTNLGLEHLDISRVPPQVDVHKKRYRHESRPG